MRFAPIADIHDNLDAFEAVLVDIAAQGFADIHNLGDHVSRPMLAAKTAGRMIELDLVTILGDQDRRLVELYAKGADSSRRMDFLELRPRHFAWIAAQPETLLWRAEMFLCHGSPRDDACYWLDLVRPDGGIEATQLAAIEVEADDITASLIFCAHTQLPRGVRLSDERMAVNPGSVGLPSYRLEKPVSHTVQTGTPDAYNAILERTPASWSVTFRHVPCDVTEMAAVDTRNSLPECRGLAMATGWIDSAGGRERPTIRHLSS